MSQVEEVEEFLVQDDEFISSRHRLCLFSGIAIPTTQVFSNPFIRSHFSFAFDILKKICSFNQALQEQYIILPRAWALIERMKNEFYDIYRQMKNGISLAFEYIGGLSEPEKRTFLIVLEKLLNIDVRFPCPSTSINSRQAQQNIDVVTATLNRPFVQSVRNNCPLFLTAGVYRFSRSRYTQK